MEKKKHTMPKSQGLHRGSFSLTRVSAPSAQVYVCLSVLAAGGFWGGHNFYILSLALKAPETPRQDKGKTSWRI